MLKPIFKVLVLSGLLSLGWLNTACTRAPGSTHAPLAASLTMESRSSNSFKLTTSAGYFKLSNRQDGLTRYHQAPELIISPSGQVAAVADNRLALDPTLVVTASQQQTLVVCPDGIVSIRDESGRQSKIGRVLLVNFAHPDKLKALENGFFEATPESGEAQSFAPDGEGKPCI